MENATVDLRTGEVNVSEAVAVSYTHLDVYKRQVYIGIMNAIRKSTFHAARYNWVKYLGSDVRSRPLQSVPRVCFGARMVVILQRETTHPRKP